MRSLEKRGSDCLNVCGISAEQKTATKNKEKKRKKITKKRERRKKSKKKPIGAYPPLRMMAGGYQVRTSYFLGHKWEVINRVKEER